MVMKNEGSNQVTFTNSGQKVNFNYPNTKVSGIIFGSKNIGIEGTMTFEDNEN